MKLPLKDIINMQTGLGKINALSEDEKTREKIPFSLKLSVARAIKLITPEIENYTNIRKEMLEKYGTRKGNTDEFDLGENAEKFSEGLKEIFEKNVDINFTKDMIKLSELQKIPVSPNDILSLEAITLDDLSNPKNNGKKVEKPNKKETPIEE